MDRSDRVKQVGFAGYARSARMTEIGLLCRTGTTVSTGQILISYLIGRTHRTAPMGLNGEKPMHVVAILNQKGGSGKTTTAVNLAAALGELGQRVLLVDLDPQASASRWLAVYDSVGGLYDLIVQRTPLEPHIQSTGVAGVDLVPARKGPRRGRT